MFWLFIIEFIMEFIMEFWWLIAFAVVLGLIGVVCRAEITDSTEMPDYHRITLEELQSTGTSEEVSHIEYNEVQPTNLITNEETQETKASKKVEDVYVYLMKNNQNGYYKIGISNNCIYREKTLQSQEPDICLVCSKKYPSRTAARQIETMLHRYYQNSHLRGEWYRLTIEESKMVQNLLN